jgi:DNA polymerase kappa
MTSSIGIACNKMLAKMCSELDKPDGQTYLSFEEDKVLEFMRSKEVRNVPGIGKVNE